MFPDDGKGVDARVLADLGNNQSIITVSPSVSSRCFPSTRHTCRSAISLFIIRRDGIWRWVFDRMWHQLG